MNILYTTLISFVISSSFVALILYVSRKLSWFDHHNERKIHTGEVPRLGGIGFASAFIIVIATLRTIYNFNSLHYSLTPFLISLLIVLLFGVIDDFKPLPPKTKMFAQTIPAIIVILSGYVFRSIDFSPMNLNISLGLLSYPITFIWIVGVTNALNLIDGVDGLAGGVSFLVSFTYGMLFLYSGHISAAIICLTLASTLCGFLLFNLPLPKARIFMGDGGSQFLGFCLAVIPLIGDGVEKTILPLPFASAILLIPIFDTFSAIWRRIRDKRRIDSPDTAHMHHKLMHLGFKSWGINLVVWILQLCICGLIFLSRKINKLESLVFFISAYILALMFFIIIHYLNRRSILFGTIKTD